MCLKRVASLACRSGGSPPRLLEPSPHVRSRAGLVVFDRGGATPDERYFGRRPANRTPRWEPREKWPRASPCLPRRSPKDEGGRETADAHQRAPRSAAPTGRCIRRRAEASARRYASTRGLSPGLRIGLEHASRLRPSEVFASSCDVRGRKATGLGPCFTPVAPPDGHPSPHPP